MIRWMLAEMEKTPAAVFYETELRERFPDGFSEAKRQRLIRPVQTPVDGASFSYGLSRPYAVVIDGAKIEAFDDENPEEDPIEINPRDLARWSLDLTALAREFQKASRLRGKPGGLDARLFFLGELTQNALRSAFLLGLFDSPSQARILLAAVHDLLPQSYDRVFIVCPTFSAAPDDLRWLEGIGVHPVPLGPDNPFSLGDEASLTVGDGATTRSRGPIALSRGVFRQEGQYWTIIYGGTTIRLADCGGLRFVVHLLKNPGTEFSALVLSAETSGRDGNEGQGNADTPVTDAEAFLAGLHVKASNDGLPVIDELARQEYGSRIRDLDDEILRAEKRGDTEQAKNAKGEKQALQQQLSAAVGLGGRSRSTASAAQRARVNVTKQIRGTLKLIASQNAPLGLFLRNAIKTGASCSYAPSHPVEWSF